MEKLTLEQAKEKYGITPEKHKEIFENMYNKAFISTFMKSDLRSKEKAKERPTAVFIGGQVGAGKSNLIILSAGEFFALGEDYILIDDDQYRKFYPNAELLSKYYPTFYTDITALGSSVITPKIMKAAIDGGYNFIFEGTMKNRRILDETMKKMPESTRKIVRVMATCYEEGILSAFERNEELIASGNNSRFIKVPEYDKTYDGLTDTVEAIEDSGIAEIVEVYKRGRDDARIPILVYSSANENNVYKSAAEAIQVERTKNSLDIVNTIPRRLNAILKSPREKTPEEIEQMKLLKATIKEHTGITLEEGEER
mgnify:CR=1 FL=1